uniref:CSON014419 protein n=1 Tax=Culicoides sonorensis TaxID=179676 RepID=A0A336LM88_CULSO
MPKKLLKKSLKTENSPIEENWNLEIISMINLQKKIKKFHYIILLTNHENFMMNFVTECHINNKKIK